MLTIQELGMSILSDKPDKIYVLGGQEYGVKDKYLEKLESLYGTRLEYDKARDLIEMLSKKHLIPLPPSLYIVRYDSDFVSSASDLAPKLLSCKVPGTVVLLYDDDKSVSKLDKYMPKNVASISQVDTKFIVKYLHQDFPKLDDRSIKIAAQYSSNYAHARNICKSMSRCAPTLLAKTDELSVVKMFGCSCANTENLETAVAKRNFASCIATLNDSDDNELDGMMYTMMQTMIELEKIKSSKYSNSPLRDYSKFWTPQDIYYMFMNCYEQLSSIRNGKITDVRSSIIYLFGLLTFKEIPSHEDMQN